VTVTSRRPAGPSAGIRAGSEAADRNEVKQAREARYSCSRRRRPAAPLEHLSRSRLPNAAVPSKAWNYILTSTTPGQEGTAYSTETSSTGSRSRSRAELLELEEREQSPSPRSRSRATNRKRHPRLQHTPHDHRSGPKARPADRGTTIRHRAVGDQVGLLRRSMASISARRVMIVLAVHRPRRRDVTDRRALRRVQRLAARRHGATRAADGPVSQWSKLRAFRWRARLIGYIAILGAALPRPRGDAVATSASTTIASASARTDLPRGGVDPRYCEWCCRARDLDDLFGCAIARFLIGRADS